MATDEITIRILLLGDVGVGKTTLCHKMKTGDFTYEYRSTIGVDFNTYIHKYKNNNYKLLFWDTTGQDKFFSLINCYFRRSNIILIMFDLTDTNCYDDILKWYVYVTHMVENTKIILVGNKRDLPNIADMNKINNFCIENNIEIINISVKSDNNFTDLMNLICDNYIEIQDNIIDNNINITQQSKYNCCRII